MKRLLIVDDEEVILKALRKLLERNHYDVHTATTVEQALQAQPQSFDLILADLRLPGAEGTDIIPAAGTVPVVIMTSHASVRSAVDAMRHGAMDYISKPFDHDELLIVIERALLQNLLKAQNQSLKLELRRNRVGLNAFSCPGVNRLIDNPNAPLKLQSFQHLYGEKGTEREAIARGLHERSDRHDAPFVVADIGIETAHADINSLFGHGLATHSAGIPPGGLLQAAQNGTLVLRQLEHLTPDAQSQLSKALSKRALTLPGSDRQRTINIKVVSIGYESIETLQSKQAIVPELADLFSHTQFVVPPLHDNPEDILPIAEQHLRSLAHRNGLKRIKLSASAIAALQANSWPGNVAELRHVIARAVFVTRSNTISRADLGFGIASTEERDLSLDEYFRYFVLRNQNTLSETDLAARLGISRKALWERRQKIGLDRGTNESTSG
jgi:DNA-binding NtrC family response regulator